MLLQYIEAVLVLIIRYVTVPIYLLLESRGQTDDSEVELSGSIIGGIIGGVIGGSLICILIIILLFIKTIWFRKHSKQIKGLHACIQSNGFSYMCSYSALVFII